MWLSYVSDELRINFLTPVSIGVDNSWGITGVATEVEALAFTESSVEHGYNRPRAVAAAAAVSGPGDIVLLEMQSTCCGRREYSPAETDPSVWTITRAAVDANVIVVAAAGNGNEDLDSAPYAQVRIVCEPSSTVCAAVLFNSIRCGAVPRQG